MKWLALLLVWGCTTEKSVFSLAEVTNCMDALVAPPGTPCEFAGSCLRPSTTDPNCCQDRAYCSANGLVVDRTCNPDCAQCMIDENCTFGAAICAGNHCMPCPPTTNCPACPMGWEPLERNGCPTCDCAPVSECSTADPNGGCMQQMEQCYPGERCAQGCMPGPGSDCCANTCSAPGCMAPSPLGCFMQCSPMMGCMQCAAEACECTNGAWTCQPRCVDNESVMTNCVAF